MENSEDEKVKNNSVEAGETIQVETISEEKLNEIKKEEKEDIKEAVAEESKTVEQTDTKIEQEEEKVEEKNNKISTTVRSTKKMSKKMIALIISICVLLILIISFGVIVCVNKVNNNVYKNVFLLGHDLSSFSSDEVSKVIDAENDKLSKEINIDFYQEDKKLRSLNSKEIGLQIDKDAVIKEIFSFGREKNIFVNNFNILKALFNKVNIDPIYKYKEEVLDEFLKNLDVEIDGRFVEDSYNVDEVNKKLIIKIGTTGKSLDYENTKKEILDKIKIGESTEIILQVYDKIPDRLSASKIYEGVKREPRDASVDTSKKPIEITNEIYGIDFDVNALQSLLDKEENKVEGKEIEFELNFIAPEVKLRDLSYDLCLEKIAGLTTYFDASQYARANNLKVALGYLNDKIIMPGEVFSYNAIIGDTTAAKGYMSAAIFKGGRVVNEMGGGICQTSSTLYNVALLANLEIVERHAHGLPVGYVRPSLDATVYGDVLDFKFKNTRNYPLKIVTSFSSSGEMNISFYGTREEVEYDIELKSNYLYTVNYKTEYIQDASMPEGQQQVVYNGVNGYASEAYFIKKLNGQVIETRYLSKDVYNAQTKTVRVGVAKVAPAVSGQS